jgi:hypothetical protein
VADPKLEEVFKRSGVPRITFVRPVEYDKLLVALRTPGRGVIIEGPSGIGKTTAVSAALTDLGIDRNVLSLSARKREDRELIAALPEMGGLGIVLIDDFHRLERTVQASIADFLKILADEERETTKLIIVGINRCGESLVAFARDLNNRIDTIKFETNPDQRIEELISKGEQALNISLDVRHEICAAANGSFYLAQMLCHETCLAAGVTEAVGNHRSVNVSFEVVRERMMEQLARTFSDCAIKFAAGTKLRREGRAPYLQILRWLAEATEWSITLDREIANHSEHRSSVGQVVEKGYLESLIKNDSAFSEVLHYDPQTRILGVEDPQFVFFLRNLSWKRFSQRVGYVNIKFESKYDFALSFAGSDRKLADLLFQSLSDMEFEVFYDKNEQHRILAENVEDYLAPIYRSDATYVICLLGPDYPKRIWTKFESDQFKERFGEGRVIPIWFVTAPPGNFDESTRVGGCTFDPNAEWQSQLAEITELLRRKMGEMRLDAEMPNASTPAASQNSA